MGDRGIYMDRTLDYVEKKGAIAPFLCVIALTNHIKCLIKHV